MSDNQLIITLIGIAVLLLIAFAVAILLRKRNESRLTALEEKKEELYNLPVNDEVEVVKNMHLIGQSQVAFREWNQKWVDLSLNSFADIENNLFEAEGFNNSFRFLKAKHQIDQIESQIELVEEDIAAIRNALVFSYPFGSRSFGIKWFFFSSLYLCWNSCPYGWWCANQGSCSRYCYGSHLRWK